MVGRLVSFWETLFSGAMLVSWRVVFRKGNGYRNSNDNVNDNDSNIRTKLHDPFEGFRCLPEKPCK